MALPNGTDDRPASRAASDSGHAGSTAGDTTPAKAHSPSRAEKREALQLVADKATKDAQNGRVKSNEFFARVKICDKQNDCCKPGHEVLKINVDASLGQLSKQILARFDAFSNLASSERANLGGVVTTGDVIKKIKVIYGNNSWDNTADGVGETILTETNCKNTLAMVGLWDKSNWGYFCAVIGPEERGYGFDDERGRSEKKVNK